MELVASKTKALDLLAVGDSHIRPLTMLPSEQVRAVPISGATMSGALNPASKTQARSTILSTVEEHSTAQCVFLALGEVDAGFLAPMKSGPANIDEAMESLDRGIDRYMTLVAEVGERAAEAKLIVGGVMPWAVPDWALRVSKIPLRRQVKLSQTARMSLIDHVNDALQVAVPKIGATFCRFDTAFDETRRNLRPNHMNPRDHHCSSWFYLNVLTRSLSDLDLGIEFQLPSRARCRRKDMRSFVRG